MLVETVTLQLPEEIYRRLASTAQATRQPLEEVILHALQVGSPPAWDDVPPEYQADLAALDKLDNEALWNILHATNSESDLARYDDLLERHSQGQTTDAERAELARLRIEADRFMLRRAHAAALLRWRGESVTQP